MKSLFILVSIWLYVAIIYFNCENVSGLKVTSSHDSFRLAHICTHLKLHRQRDLFFKFASIAKGTWQQNDCVGAPILSVSSVPWPSAPDAFSFFREEEQKMSSSSAISYQSTVDPNALVFAGL